MFAFLHAAVPWWLVLFLGFVPVLVWGAFFIRKDSKQPEPRSLLRMTFVAGYLCTIPVVLYTRYAATHPQVDISTALQALPIPEWIQLGLFFLFVAIVEEYVKHVAMVWVVSKNKREFTQVVDGIVYAVAAAMGFAFLENTIYLSDASRSVIAIVFLSRGLGATLGHAIFSGTFGYFYARAAFATDLIDRKRETLWDFHRALPLSMGFHILRTHILPHRGVMERGHTRAQLIAEGFWAAVALHFLYNFIASGVVTMIPAFGEYDLTYLLVPVLMGGMLLLLRFFANPANQRVHKAAVYIATLPEYLIPSKRASDIRRDLKLSPGFEPKRTNQVPATRSGRAVRPSRTQPRRRSSR